MDKVDPQTPRPAPRRWWLLAAAAVALLVAGAFALPRLMADDGPASASTSTDCVGTTDVLLREIDARDATWVRFCPLADEGAAQRVRHPQGVLTGDLASSVAASLVETQAGRRVCTPDEATPGPSGLFRIEVGLADGRVTELAGDTGCSSRDEVLFSQLETTLLMQAAAGVGAAGPTPRPVTCPDRFTTTRTHADGASGGQLVDEAENPWQSTVPLLPLPATAADVCAYAGDGPRRDLVDQWRVGTPVAESIRAAATTGVMLGAMTDCQLVPDARSYVVGLTDATATARTLALDPTVCSTLQAAVGTPAVDTYLGLAGDRLVRLVAGSKP
ncbi:MAG TPA: hypothetical protein VGD39_00975 [Nocardioides sp.]